MKTPNGLITRCVVDSGSINRVLWELNAPRAKQKTSVAFFCLPRSLLRENGRLYFYCLHIHTLVLSLLHSSCKLSGIGPEDFLPHTADPVLKYETVHSALHFFTTASFISLLFHFLCQLNVSSFSPVSAVVGPWNKKDHKTSQGLLKSQISKG